MAAAGGGSGGFSPSDITGMVLWLDAENYSGSGTEWPDAGPNNLDATLASSPTWGTHAGGRRMFSFDGSSQYAYVPDNALLDFGAADSFSLVIISQQAAYSAGESMVFKRFNLVDVGYSIRNGTGTPAAAAYQIKDASTTVTLSSASRSTGALYMDALVRDVGADLLRAYSDNTAITAVADTTTGTLANAHALTIAADGNLSARASIDVLAVILYAAVLTVDDIADLCTYYGTV